MKSCACSRSLLTQSDCAFLARRRLASSRSAIALSMRSSASCRYPSKGSQSSSLSEPAGCWAAAAWGGGEGAEAGAGDGEGAARGASGVGDEGSGVPGVASDSLRARIRGR